MSQLPPPVPGSAIPEDAGLPAEPPAWPKVIGILSIVFGSLGVVCGGCGVLSGAMSSSLISMVPPEQQAQMKQQMAAASSPLAIGAAALGALVAVLLIVAGIVTLQRKAVGRPLHLGYGVLAIIVAAIGLFAQWGALQAQLNAPPPPGTPANVAQIQKTSGMIGMGIGACFSFAYPVFTLVWFGPMGKRPNQGFDSSDPIA